MNNKELEEEARRRQEILDDAWHLPKQHYINGIPVSYREWWEYMEEERLLNAQLEAERSFYKRCTSTGEEWEVDSDGEYTPEEFWDK